MKNPKFKIVKAAEDLTLVYRQFSGMIYGFSVTQGNCILWNSEIGQDEELAKSQGIEILKKMTSWV
jgi:hypothetical protein